MGGALAAGLLAAGAVSPRSELRIRIRIAARNWKQKWWYPVAARTIASSSQRAIWWCWR